MNIEKILGNRNKKCFVDGCENKIPYSFFEAPILCKNHKNIFDEEIKNVETNWHKIEISVYKNIGVNIERLREYVLKHDKKGRENFPYLFENDSIKTDEINKEEVK